MKIAFFSDAHKHYNKRKVGFSFTDIEFKQALVLMNDKSDLIVSLGDLWELWAGKLPFRKYSIEDFHKIAKKYPLSHKYLMDKVTILPGNHDDLIQNIISEKVQIDKLVIKNSKGERLIAFHGVYDFTNKYLPSIAHIISWATYNLRFIFSIDIELYLSKVIGLSLFNNFTQLK